MSYLPHTIGFIIAKFLALSPFLIGMIGRLFNLMAYIVLGYYALKILPKYKMFYFVILMSPNLI